jgi:regulator of sigma E protease
MTLIAFIVLLGIVILVHEWGHFIAARLCGIRVETFSIGMGPRIWGWKSGGTDYRLSALPIGGYVKMAGDNPTEERSGAADEFLSKPRWQRAIVAMAGPAMNIVLAVAIMTTLYVRGMAQPKYFGSPVEVAGVMKNSEAERAGLQPGDRVVEFAGTSNPTWDQVQLELVLSLPGTEFHVVVERGGQRVPLQVRGHYNDPAAEPHFQVLGYPRDRVFVGSLSAEGPGSRAGMKVGDVILSLNGQPVLHPMHFRERIQETGAGPVSIALLRESKELTLEVAPERAGDRYRVGLGFRWDNEVRSHALLPALRRSAWFNLRFARQILTVLGQLFRGRASIKELGGPIEIARQSGEAAKLGLIYFVQFMAIISLNLAILNLLPIPILDGGHLLLLSIEGLLRRDLSLAFKERFVQVGFVALLVLFSVVMYNDIDKLLPGR